MSLSYDPEVGAIISALAAVSDSAPARGDRLAIRRMVERTYTSGSRTLPPAPDVSISVFSVTADDGATLSLRWYVHEASRPGSAVLYVHGGGMIACSAQSYDADVSGCVQNSGVPFLSVDYRLAPEHPGTGPVTDAAAGLSWLIDHAGDLGVDPARIGIMGDSAGGGIAAGVTLLAREKGWALARQILVYPMLDDRTTVDPRLAPLATWTYDFNHTGWHALLGEDLGGEDVSPLCAPARATDLAGLPPAYIEVGELDIFRDEDIDYARRLMQAGVSVELHVRPGVPHGFDVLAPGAAVSKRAMADRYRVIRSL